MSTPQNQPPYQQPYQPPYQAVPPYGQQRPRPTHAGKLVAAIILFITGPLLGAFIAGIGSVITNGQQVTLSSNEERTLYVPEDVIVSTCTVTAPDGKEVPVSRSTGAHISNNNGRYESALTFKTAKAGSYRVSCDDLSDTDTVLVGAGLTFRPFMWPLVAGICAGAVFWIIAAVLLIRRRRALAAQTQAG